MRQGQLSFIALAGLVVLVLFGLIIGFSVHENKGQIVATSLDDMKTQDFAAADSFLKECFHDETIQTISHLGMVPDDAFENELKAGVKQCLASLSRQQSFEFNLEQGEPRIELENHAETFIATIVLDAVFSHGKHIFHAGAYPVVVKKSKSDLIFMDEMFRTTELKKIVSRDGRAVLFIPPGTRINWPGREHEIQLKIRNKRDFDSNVVGNIIYELLPHGLTFTSDVILRIEYPEEFLSSPEAEKSLNVAWYDEHKRLWIKITSLIDKKKNYLYGFVGHFSLFSASENCNVRQEFALNNIYQQSCDKQDEPIFCENWRLLNNGRLLYKGSEQLGHSIHTDSSESGGEEHDWIVHNGRCYYDKQYLGTIPVPEPSFPAKTYYSEQQSVGGKGSFMLSIAENSCVDRNAVHFKELDIDDYISSFTVEENDNSTYQIKGRFGTRCEVLQEDITNIKDVLSQTEMNKNIGTGNNLFKFNVGNLYGGCANVNGKLVAIGSKDAFMITSGGTIEKRRTEVINTPDVNDGFLKDDIRVYKNGKVVEDIGATAQDRINFLCKYGSAPVPDPGLSEEEIQEHYAQYENPAYPDCTAPNAGSEIASEINELAKYRQEKTLADLGYTGSGYFEEIALNEDQKCEIAPGPLTGTMIEEPAVKEPARINKDRNNNKVRIRVDLGNRKTIVSYEGCDFLSKEYGIAIGRENFFVTGQAQNRFGNWPDYTPEGEFVLQSICSDDRIWNHYSDSTYPMVNCIANPWRFNTESNNDLYGPCWMRWKLLGDEVFGNKYLVSYQGMEGTFDTLPYAFHGNNNKDSIGTKASGGCVRMHNKEVVELCENIYACVGTNLENVHIYSYGRSLEQPQT